MKKIRVILTGGFLGTGKTTSVIQLAKQFEAKGMKAGIILNDQGSSLVDGELVKSSGFATAEITGGCFCCRFNDLIYGFDKLIHETDPDILIAEPVGSCTDLISTVFLPLQKYYPGRFTLAPFSVLADGTMLNKHNSAGSFPFSQEIMYLYEKQLEEANIILINKVDLLDREDVLELREVLQKKHPGKPIIPICASNGTGFDIWIQELFVETPKFHSLKNIDYELYGKAESMLGWYNSTLHIQCPNVFDPNDFIDELMSAILSNVDAVNGKISHLKCIGKCSGGLIKASITQDTGTAVFSAKGYDFTKELDIIINARVEMEAVLLKRAIQDAIDLLAAKYVLKVRLDHVECFKPSFPTPTYPREDYNKCL